MNPISKQVSSAEYSASSWLISLVQFPWRVSNTETSKG